MGKEPANKIKILVQNLTHSVPTPFLGERMVTLKEKGATELIFCAITYI
jgi:hypothetical protein